MPTVLGIDVDPALFDSWCRWLAPDTQPFLVRSTEEWRDCADEGGSLTPELADTYRMWWGVDKQSEVLWISEEQFTELPRHTRAALVREQVARRRGAVPTVRAWQDVLGRTNLGSADGHRFVWWPSLVATRPEQILSRVVTTGRLPSRHHEVTRETWQSSKAVLPEARRLSGTFPSRSNMNCFGAVMESAGAASAAAVFDDVEPFEQWLRSRCSLGGDTSSPGVVLVWRNRAGAPVHAAVAIGGGWALEKPSRDWHAPTAVVQVRDVMRMSRHPGERVERHTIAR